MSKMQRSSSGRSDWEVEKKPSPKPKANAQAPVGPVPVHCPPPAMLAHTSGRGGLDPVAPPPVMQDVSSAVLDDTELRMLATDSGRSSLSGYDPLAPPSRSSGVGERMLATDSGRSSLCGYDPLAPPRQCSSDEEAMPSSSSGPCDVCAKDIEALSGFDCDVCLQLVCFDCVTKNGSKGNKRTCSTCWDSLQEGLQNNED